MAFRLVPLTLNEVRRGFVNRSKNRLRGKAGWWRKVGRPRPVQLGFRRVVLDRRHSPCVVTVNEYGRTQTASEIMIPSPKRKPSEIRLVSACPLRLSRGEGSYR
jgi:hypothetical protein